MPTPTNPAASPPRAIVIGAGPAGLTAAYELLRRTGIVPLILEKSAFIGGLSRTARYKGNRMDIGGHRFFSKSDRVLAWWRAHLPIERTPETPGPDPAREDRVLLVRRRQSRIYFLRRLFAYPIRLNLATLARLGPHRTIRIGLSYLRSLFFPIRRPVNLEQFFISRFGRYLYELFFRSYTEKVWGVPCREIDAAWGEQRIKGLSISRALAHAARRLLPRPRDIAQKDTETSLIERFLYPKFGPGQMWETVADEVAALGGRILLSHEAVALRVEDGRIAAVETVDAQGCHQFFEADLVFSTMPVADLVRAVQPPPPPALAAIGEGLVYRDFITVGILARRLALAPPVADNWIYIQEPGILAGRLQIFNNWSPYLAADPATVWLGVEYFCREGDTLWARSDADMRALAIDELHRIGILDRAAVLDACVLRVPKAYPAYFGAYAHFGQLRAWLDGIENLFLIGRNGMHRYNNQDHSMLAAMVAVDNIVAGWRDKSNIWAVNTETAYHEDTPAACG